ncbi:ParB N-terminal domain-containing protein [Alcanivorax sp. 1008]|uniref:ParB N-terminal domain-containing protein n=1 Tax=Alcanivorax sp. 1008 TaxID=2816853 RepID=UPI001D96CA89|nr:ParB N-terminal domain-containing protein [Alcanivorax sp. 1008]MCC1496900.1 ParB N-terminal domain-containing protein [Alcanivorax sp. 1008]
MEDGQYVEIDPRRVAPRLWSDRDPEQAADEDALRGLEYSFSVVGQLQPGVVRAMSAERQADYPDCEYELVTGYRRLLVCKNLGRPFKAIVRDLSDADAHSAMVSENDDRKPVVEFERAISFKHALNIGTYDSQDALVDGYNADKAVGHIDKSKLSKMLKVAEIIDIDWFVAAALDLWEIKIAPGYKLMTSIDQDLEARAIARRICERQVAKSGERSIKAKALIKEINEAIDKSKNPEKETPLAKEFKGSRGQSLAVTNANLIFRVPADLAKSATRDQIREYFEELLPHMIMAYDSGDEGQGGSVDQTEDDDSRAA